MNLPNTYVRLNELPPSAELLLQQSIPKGRQNPLMKTTQKHLTSSKRRPLMTISPIV